MEVTLPTDLRKQVEQELARGRYHSPDELIEQAVRHFLDERQRGQRRLDALRRIGQAVDQAGLYERVLISDQMWSYSAQLAA
jgi:Arc/MetJ-type ribon-helix-helix transcriptional regulator